MTVAEPVAEPVATAPPPFNPHGRLPVPVLAGGVAALVVVHLALLLRVDGPLIFDGTGYLANARWLAGRGAPFMGQVSFYHPGWSMLLVPIFRLIHDPQTIYRGALLLNVLIASASLLAYDALGRALGLRPVPAFLAALAAALYPAVLLQSTIEWSESLFQVLVVLMILALHRLVIHRSARSAALAGALAPALYATHPRGLGVVPVIIVGLLVLARMRIIAWRDALVGVALAVVGFVAVRVLNGRLLDAMWPADRPLSEGDVLSRLTDPHLAWNAVVRAVGQLWYLVAASCGFAVGGVWVLVDRARGKRGRRVAAFAWLCLATMAAIVGASALMMADATRVDHLVYGRYNEGFLPSLLVFGVVGLASLHRARQSMAAAAVVGASAGLLGLLTVVLNGGNRFAGAVAPVNVIGLLVWSPHRDNVRLLQITLGALAVAAVILAVHRRSLRASLVLLCAFFLVSSAIVRHDDLGPWASYWSGVHRLPAAVRALPVDDREPVSILRDFYEPEAADFYQFQLLDRPVSMWDGAATPASLVIAPRGWSEAKQRGARLAFPESTYASALWVMPGPVQDRLAAGGFLFGADILAPLPDAARQAAIEGHDVSMAAGTSKFVKVAVAHLGSGSPWPNLQVAGERLGAVRLQAVWDTEGGTGVGDLDQVLLPGQRGHVQLYLTAPAKAGRYEVRLQLLQEGGKVLDGASTITVTVR